LIFLSGSVSYELGYTLLLWSKGREVKRIPFHPGIPKQRRGHSMRDIGMYFIHRHNSSRSQILFTGSVYNVLIFVVQIDFQFQRGVIIVESYVVGDTHSNSN